MKIKPSSANTKKPLLSDKPIPPKKPTIVKCFICNQMFYSQDTFDSHMDQHQKKVNKNLPDEIQRKTMQNFGLKQKQSLGKKNTTLQAINQNEVKDKKFFNKTMKLPHNSVQPIMQNHFITKFNQAKSSMLKKPSVKSQQLSWSKQQKRQISQSPIKNNIEGDRQLTQINDAIKQSTLLMKQMEFITQKYEHDRQIFLTEETYSDHDGQNQQNCETQKTVSEHQFINLMKSNNWSLNKIQEQILKVDFSSYQSLENCQIQIEYLRKIMNYSQDSKSLESISKTKSKILAEVVTIIMSQNTQIYKPQQNKIQQKQIREQQNFQARTCSQCLDMIGFGQICILQGDQFFHKECFLEKNKLFF